MRVVIKEDQKDSFLISPDVRLACAIRWLSGGSAYDLLTKYGFGHSDIIRSYRYVVDAIFSSKLQD
jgi:hypothetical protein